MRPFQTSTSDRDAFGRGGFTIMELLVAMVITALLVLVLSQATYMASSIWTRIEGNTGRHQSARAILEAIRLDLSNALLSPKPSATTDSSHSDGLQFVVNPSLPQEWNNPNSIFWQAPIAPDSKSGEIAEAGYFIRWDTSDASHPRAHLCRFYVSPEDVNNFRIYSDPSNWLTEAVVDAVAKGDKASDYAGLFAEDVIGLWTKCMKWDSTSNALIPIASDVNGPFDSRAGYDPTTDSATGKAVSKRLPYAVEIGLVLLDSAHASRVGAAEQAAIVQLAGQTSSPTDFIERARRDATLKKLAPGMSAHSSIIRLKNYSDLSY